MAGHIWWQEHEFDVAQIYHPNAMLITLFTIRDQMRRCIVTEKAIFRPILHIELNHYSAGELRATVQHAINWET
jgi:hypothetical protein